MKIKPFSGIKRCSAGDTYIFRKGLAEVQGFFFKGKPVKINIQQFIRENNSGKN